ncbi:MAG: tryptophan synthase subunit alpha [Candidatus Omnitrophica bacterium]|nr:tryptophan synthase subunit alpha [Candidatus Omnitrophota bacterium]
METLRSTFQRLKRAGKAALMPFIMGGDPDLSATGPLLLALQEAGADLIEVGIPFSDPLADGPTIQSASFRALSRGATPQRVLDAIASVRRHLHVPVVCLSYCNPIFHFKSRGKTPESSIHSFARYSFLSGVCGVIVPDLSLEESGSFRQAASAEGLATILLAAPTSPPDRLFQIARASQGFIYYVSVTGTTGVRRILPQALAVGVRQLQRISAKPVCVGFGISTAQQVAQVASFADGVIVGSVLVRELEKARNRKTLLSKAKTLIGSFKKALETASRRKK